MAILLQQFPLFIPFAVVVLDNLEFQHGEGSNRQIIGGYKFNRVTTLLIIAISISLNVEFENEHDVFYCIIIAFI